MNNSSTSKVKTSSLPAPPGNYNQTSKAHATTNLAAAVNTDQVGLLFLPFPRWLHDFIPLNNYNFFQILTKNRLQDLVKEIDPCEQLDDEVEDLLLQMVDDFVTSTVSSACVFAKHRNASTVEAKDVQLYLGK